MGRHASDPGGNDFEPAPAGTHIARCIRLIDIGTQHGEYEGKPTTRNQVIVMWELPDELIEIEGEQKPAIVSKFYTNSLHKKAAMRQDLESWRGKTFSDDELAGFDLQNLLGVPALVTVIHTDKGKAKVNGVAKVVKGLSIPAQINDSKSFWLDDFDQEVFDTLSEGLQDLIRKSDEYKALKTPAAKGKADDLDDDIPF
jgi:hypothetical protein